MSHAAPTTVNREAELTRTIGVGSGGFVRLRLNVCGKHWGSGGECCKCRAIAKDSPVAGALLAVYNATFYPPEI